MKKLILDWMLLIVTGLALGIMFGLAGCVNFSEMSRETKIEEFSWQALHAVDIAQTAHVLNRDADCFHESNKLLGTNPSNAKLAVFWLGFAWLHAAVTTFLADAADDGDSWLVRTWEAVSITDQGVTVYRNHQVGARLFAPNDRQSGCGDRAS